MKVAETVVYSLRQASLHIDGRAILSGLDLEIRGGEITVVLGPGGAGKSSLLRALAGRAIESGGTLAGQWQFCGGIVAADDRSVRDRVAWIRQRPHAWSPSRAADASSDTLERAAGALAVLYDEPLERPGAAARQAVIGELRARAAAGAAVVVVTHDLELARALADAVLMFCDGTLEVATRAEEFFERPPTPLAAQFLAQGNCCPPPRPPRPLPSHFRWILPGQLAGMGRLGLLGNPAEDAEAIAEAGITMLVSLTEDPPPVDLLRSVGIASRHLPIPDMGAPAISPAANVCRDTERLLRGGGAVAFHCHAGIGRTGTMLAATLVWLGDDAAHAIARVREVRPTYLQTKAQESFVQRFALAVGPVRTAGVP